MLNRISEHKLLRARQGGLGDVLNPGGNANGNGNGDGDSAAASSEPPQSSTGPASSQPTSQSSTSPSTTSTVTEPTTTPPSTSSQAPSTSIPPSTTQRASTTTSTSSSNPFLSIVFPSSSSSSTSSIVTSSTQSTTRSTTSSSTTVAGFAKTSLVVETDDDSPTSSFRTVTRTSASLGEGSTVTASDTPTVSGAINTGAVVGGIAGGLIALAALGFIICFFMRRRNRRRRADEFSASQFRRSAMIMPDDHFTSNPPASPIVPQMYERGHGVAPSVTSMSGPGVAGQGAAYYNSQAQNPQDYRNQYSDHPYATSPPSRIQAQPSQPLQERPQYTFGQAPDGNYHPNVILDDGHGNYEGHGAYSSEPQMQMAYNAEEYSGYHAYSPDQAQGYAGAHPGYAEGYAEGHAGYAGAHARTKSSNTVADDAYGGI